MSSILPKNMEKNPRWTGKKCLKPQTQEIIVSWQEDAAGCVRAPWTAKAGTLAKLDHDKAEQCHRDNLCSACGEKFTPGDMYVFFSGLYSVEGFNQEPPLHKACAGYVARTCPYIREERFEVILTNAYIVKRGHYSPQLLEEVGKLLFKPVWNLDTQFMLYEEFISDTKPFLKK